MAETIASADGLPACPPMPGDPGENMASTELPRSVIPAACGAAAGVAAKGLDADVSGTGVTPAAAPASPAGTPVRRRGDASGEIGGLTNTAASFFAGSAFLVWPAGGGTCAEPLPLRPSSLLCLPAKSTQCEKQVAVSAARRQAASLQYGGGAHHALRGSDTPPGTSCAGTAHQLVTWRPLDAFNLKAAGSARARPHL